MHILTGFLGSGKTTLLRHLLRQPGLGDTAVVINEFGEVGLDHALLRQVAEDVVLLESGCVCCSVRDDLISTLSRLRALAAAGEIPRFSRLAVETTGLADPIPIAQAILSDRRLVTGHRLGRIVATVDAVFGERRLCTDAIAASQAAVADCLVISKTDLATEAGVAALRRSLARLNPSAAILISRLEAMPDGDELLAGETARATPPGTEGRYGPPPAATPGHHAGVETFHIQFDEAVDWHDFVEWMELLLAARGDNVLRVKGLLAVRGERGPLVIQGVQHAVYPPERLEAWPDNPGRTRLVFITRALTRSAVERSLREVIGVTPLALERSIAP